MFYNWLPLNKFIFCDNLRMKVYLIHFIFFATSLEKKSLVHAYGKLIDRYFQNFSLIMCIKL